MYSDFIIVIIIFIIFIIIIVIIIIIIIINNNNIITMIIIISINIIVADTLIRFSYLSCFSLMNNIFSGVPILQLFRITYRVWI